MVTLKRSYKQKALPILLGFLLLILLLWLQISANPLINFWRESIDNLLYDLVLTSQTLSAPKQNVPVAIVLIDDQSLAEQGHWPWPRQKLAILVSQLKKLGATVIAMDATFPEAELNPVTNLYQQLQAKGLKNVLNMNSQLQQLASELDQDLIFAKSLQTIDTTLGIYFHVNRKAQEGILPPPFMTLQPSFAAATTLISLPYYTSNYIKLQQAAKASGFINNISDPDGEVRRSPLVILYHNSLYASLSLAAVKLYLLSDAKVTWQQLGDQWGINQIILGKQLIPVDHEGKVLVPFHLLKSIPSISAADVFKNRLTPNALAGKLVFLGSSATGLGDLKTTPIQDALPGVNIHAAIAAGVLLNSFYSIPNWAQGAEFLLSLLVGLVCLVLFPFLRANWLAISALMFIALLTMLGFWLYIYQKIFLSLAIPVFMVFFLAVLNSIYGYFSEEHRRNQLRGMFSQYIPPAYLKRLLEQDKVPQSETLEMTVLFCDIRNFTSISEKMSAAAIAQMLNQFFTPMTEIIFQYGGTIDKYVGDMVMAFWGAPLPDPDHAKHALQAALAMQAKAVELREQFGAGGLPVINIGIGINSGLMNVGDMGSKFRRAYTVIGDAVNLASRLETLTKEYHAEIIVSEATQHNQADFKFERLGEVKVKGKEEPVMIYKLLGKSDNHTKDRH